MTSVAIMQPYFLPYSGYFRLFHAADVLALFDCVQFPRRGWVHRNQLPGVAGVPHWLTLPLAKGPVETRIADLAFTPDARETFVARCRAFPVLRERDHPVVRAMRETEGDFVDYLARLLELCCAEMGLQFNVLRTSRLSIDPTLRGQDRVLAIAQNLGATRYINLSGGKRLYDKQAFDDRNIELVFLEEWQGPMWSILYRLLTEPAGNVTGDIRAQG